MATLRERQFRSVCVCVSSGVVQWNGASPSLALRTTTTTSTSVGSIRRCSVSFHGAMHLAIRAVHLHTQLSPPFSPYPS